MDEFDDPRITDIGILFEAANGVRSKLEPIWQEAGLSVLDFTALTRLTRSAGRRMRMTDLAAQAQLSTSGVTRLVDRLERNGFARREPDPVDRRSSYAVLTDHGEATMAAVWPKYLATLDTWFFDLITPEQRETLVGILRHIRETTFPDAAKTTD
ncbi:MarR family winged helix-turn-helix transcriptional regulator [Nocardia stercoris]|uniref:MarR family transcriptional regulator n=1 Tax=Nocardia stercoris TaxID=2483361 RepID=A0A3M2KRL5_9NOCA|nr:MarR family winged helix-turn-helix transcriptional regulator [Nocardia stercoris]RMI28297.1 MarR family transcriptional regulator [Nocardia stercoris]